MATVIEVSKYKHTFKEYVVEVTDVDSGGDIKYPFYALINIKFDDKEAEMRSLMMAKKDCETNPILGGNHGECEFVGFSGRIVEKITIFNELQPREKDMEEDQFMKMM